jgi:hypothetical protein
MESHKKTHCHGNVEARLLIAICDSAVLNKRRRRFVCVHKLETADTTT